MQFEQDFKKIRMYEGRTQKWVAERLGVSKSQISANEINQGGTRYSRVIDILDALGYEIQIKKKEKERE